MKHINVALFVPHEGCPHTCTFCNQKTISGACSKLTKADVDAAVAVAMKGNYDRDNSEIAFFGGSFTAIDRAYMISLLEVAYSYVQQGHFKGIRCSTRPDAIDEEVLSVLKQYGVTAIELGAQSMSDRVLSLNERGHTAQDIANASSLIKSHGFSLGLQMMTGLYGDDDMTAMETARKIIDLRPDCVRIYPTTVLEHTKLAELYKAGLYEPQTLESAVALCSKLLMMFTEKNIRVIRLGLHSGGHVEEGYLAGAYHPAFRELCENRIFLENALTIIKKQHIIGAAVIYVSPSAISKMTGQKRQNLLLLQEQGIYAVVRGDPTLSGYEIRIET